jgi:hypothetical protein
MFDDAVNRLAEFNSLLARAIAIKSSEQRLSCVQAEECAGCAATEVITRIWDRKHSPGYNSANDISKMLDAVELILKARHEFIEWYRNRDRNEKPQNEIKIVSLPSS